MPTNVSMDKATRGRLRACAVLRGQTMAKVIRDAVAEFVDRHGILAGGDWRVRPDANHAWCRASSTQASVAREEGWDVVPIIKHGEEDDGEY